MIVLDANILIRAVLGSRVKHLLETYRLKGLRFFAPDQVFVEAATHLPSVLKPEA